MKYSLRLFVFSVFLFSFLSLFSSITLTGVITDAATGETLPGVSILVKNSNKGTVSDFDGKYELDLNPGKYTLSISYLSYATIELNDVEILHNKIIHLNIPMEESAQALKELVVVSMRRMNSEVALLSSVREATSVVSAISAQQISKNQDKDAAEVIKRIPGISIMNDRFIITRGLAQRYNNVWINNSAVPSSESDTRAFSFDIIPSSQIENIMVVKSPQPELPADFSGGFVKITTRGIPSDNSIEFSYGMGFNPQTHFQDFKYNKGAATDFLGFDNGTRQIASFVPWPVDNNDADLVTRTTKEGFNKNWKVSTKKPLPDQSLSLVINRKFNTKNNKDWGWVTAINYSNKNSTYRNMQNNRFDVYNYIEDKEEYVYKYTDNQFNNDVRIGLISNLVFIPNANNKFEFRNLFNQLVKNRYTERDGFEYHSAKYFQKKHEYIYNSRSAYSGQLSGNHTLKNDNRLEWIGGFSYANRHQPDRRIIEQEQNTSPADKYYQQYEINQNDISRDFIKLNEFTYSLALNYNHNIELGSFKPIIKTGLYAEHKDRDYKNRLFYYRWNNENLPEDFAYQNPIDNILVEDNYAYNKLYLFDKTDNTNSYFGKNSLLAAYFAGSIPLNKFNIYAGLRVEKNQMTLTSYSRENEFITKDTDYNDLDFFPSVNLSYNLNNENLMRLSYGKSINRPEFREVSGSTYRDFELFSSIMGDPELKSALIHNYDFRYEYYPSKSELISLAFFYKRFNNPIEWVYIDSGGGSYTYTFQNAFAADNLGLELEIKKNLDFIGLKDFSFNFNAALIHSKVDFQNSKLEHDRPMQGQSPYLINTGLFYNNNDLGLNIGLLYNIIGRRIIGIGRVQTQGGETLNNDIPDMYEMPRNIIDFNLSKKIGKNLEISANLRDILAQEVTFSQFPKFNNTNGELQERKQITRSFKPGQNFSISIKYSL